MTDDDLRRFVRAIAPEQLGRVVYAERMAWEWEISPSAVPARPWEQLSDSMRTLYERSGVAVLDCVVRRMGELLGMSYEGLTTFGKEDLAVLFENDDRPRGVKCL